MKILVFAILLLFGSLSFAAICDPGACDPDENIEAAQGEVEGRTFCWRNPENLSHILSITFHKDRRLSFGDSLAGHPGPNPPCHTWAVNSAYQAEVISCDNEFVGFLNIRPAGHRFQPTEVVDVNSDYRVYTIRNCAP